jgi:hypothetical protein
MRPRLEDVARLANVHPATVSRALSERSCKLVNAETLDRVVRAAEELNYLPNTMARSLAMLSTDTAAPVTTAEITVRGDSAYGSRAVIRVYHRYGAVFSLMRNRNAAVQDRQQTGPAQRRVPAGRNAPSMPIAEDAWTTVRYPGAVRDRDTGAWATTSCICQRIRRPGADGGHPAPHDHRA